MTNTTIYNAVNMPATAGVLNASPTKTVLQTGTTAVVLNVQLKGGTEDYNRGEQFRLYYAVSPFSLTADATLPFQFPTAVGILEVKFPAGGQTTARIDTTGCILNNGGNLYTWYDCPPSTPSGTGTVGNITVTSVELP